MDKYSPFILALAGCATFLLSTAKAEIIGIETFDYPGGAIDGQSGGTHWDWKNVSGSAMHTGTASDWTNVVGSAQVVNGKLVTNGSAAKREYNGANEAEGAVNDGTEHRQVYYRVEVRIDDYLSQSVGLSSYDFAAERIFFGVPFSAGAQLFGIEETGVDRNDSAVIANSPQTYTLVTKLDFGGDLLSIWVNPDLSQPELSASPAVTRAYTNTNWSTAVRLNSSAETTWDNLVVATTWDDLKVIDPGAGLPLAADTRLGAGGTNNHSPYFHDFGNSARLSNGNVVVAYGARENDSASPVGPDGDEAGAFFRIYGTDGNPLTVAPVAPYLDINAAGTGWQANSLVTPLAGGGFVVTWASIGGPGDVPSGETELFGLGDAYMRVYANDGTPLSGSVKVNEFEPNAPQGNAQVVEQVIPLSGGGFAAIWLDDNDEVTGADGKNDYFVRTFTAAGTALGGSLQIGDASHDVHFQELGPCSALSDGGFVVAWSTRGSGATSPDGDGFGAFFQTFNANGTAESAVTFPYIDTNAAGTGTQWFPFTTPLASGFAISWTSYGATGDIGGSQFSGGDAYMRVYDNTGVATNSTTKVNDLTTEWNDRPVAMTTLSGGNFVIAWNDGEDEKDAGATSGPNKDDFFVRTYTAAGVALGASVQLGDALQAGIFQRFGNLIPLSDGGFATCWQTGNYDGVDADGADNGSFLQAFNADGTDRSGIVVPYLDINPSATGDQNNPILTSLSAGGIAATWNSAFGPGDVGGDPADFQGGDTYTRLFDNSGTPISTTQQAHVSEPSGFDDSQLPIAITEGLNNYAVVFFDDNENAAAPTDENTDHIRFFSLTAPASSGNGPVMVTNTADSGPGSLRAAIENAPADKGTINFDPSLSGKLIRLLGGELATAGKTDLAIDASNLPDGITIDGFENARVFLVAGGSVSMHYLGITGGNFTAGSGGGIRAENGSLDVTHSTIWGNRANSGAGIYSNTNLAGTETTTLRRCTIANNVAIEEGGGLRNNDGVTKLISCTIAGNSAAVDSGGGIMSYGDTATRTEMFACIVRDNSGGDTEIVFGTGNNSFQSDGSNIVGTGDAIGEFVETGDVSGTTTPINLTALNKFGGPTMTMHPRNGSPAVNPATSFTARTDQRGFHISANADIGAVESGCFVYNTFTGGAGSLQQTITDCPDGGHVTFDPSLSGTTIFNTSGGIGIGKELTIDAAPLIDGITLSGSNQNRVFDVFGNGDLTLKKLTIANGEEDTENGGGIFVTGPGSLTMFDCTIRDCTAPCAGAITSDGFVTLIRSTLSGNTAGTGGAICNGGAGVLTLNHSTISANQATNDGGGIAFFGGTLSLENSIVAGNTAPSFENLTNPPITQTGTNLISGTPGLAPLTDNGGPTHTMLPLPGSAAADSASGSTDLLDQRGQFRDIFADIGAAEFRVTDLASIWESDFDNDGNPFGMEHALGTDPFVADPDNSANPQVRFNAPGDAVIEFGYNTSAFGETTWILERSYTLDSNDWEQVYLSEDPDNGETTDFDILINAATSVELTDITAPAGTKRAFYRFKARLDLP